MVNFLIKIMYDYYKTRLVNLIFKYINENYHTLANSNNIIHLNFKINYYSIDWKGVTNFSPSVYFIWGNG